MISILWACAVPEPVPLHEGVDVAHTAVVASAEAGICSSFGFQVQAGAASEATVELSDWTADCEGGPFGGGSTAITIDGGATVALSFDYCPVEAGSCAALATLSWSAGDTVGTETLEVIGVATSPDQDDDGYRVSEGDCDDGDARHHPGATEQADDEDDDCDGRVDEGTATGDDDDDGWTERDGDCDDSDPLRSPDMPETINGVDDDCDGWVDNHTDAFDDDRDGYSEGEGDCSDLDPRVFPLANEFPAGHADGIDNDCDGVIDETAP